MQHEPGQNTRPLQRARTAPLGDAFVASGTGPLPNATRPLRPPAGQLKEAVSAKLNEVKRELDYVRHLMSLFAPSIQILRYAVHLTTLPELPALEAFDEPIDPLSEPEAFDGMGAPQRKFARDIAEVLIRDPRVKQRAQVALYQFDEVVRAYDEGQATIDAIATCAFEEAWERLQELGIERTKGKAYAVCGFWDNFKRDPVICKLFPPPTPQNTRGTQPLNVNTAQAASGPLNAGQPGSGQLPRQASAQPPKAASPEPSGLLGKLKGFFK